MKNADKDNLFKKQFGSDLSVIPQSEWPAEIVEILNKKFPDGVRLVKDKDGEILVYAFLSV